MGFKAEEQKTMIADEACSQGSVDRAAFVRSLKTELRVAIAKETPVLHACICHLARKTVKALPKWATCPQTEDSVFGI